MQLLEKYYLKHTLRWALNTPKGLEIYLNLVNGSNKVYNARVIIL